MAKEILFFFLLFLVGNMAKEMQNARYVTDPSGKYVTVIPGGQLDFKVTGGIPTAPTINYLEAFPLKGSGNTVNDFVEIKTIELGSGNVLTVSGKAPLPTQSPTPSTDIMYALVFEMMFTKIPAPTAWATAVPVSVCASIPNVKGQYPNSPTQLHRTLQLDPTPLLRWKEIMVADFVINKASMNLSTDLSFNLTIDASRLLPNETFSGLVIMAAGIRQVLNYPIPSPPVAGEQDKSTTNWIMNATKLSVYQSWPENQWTWNLNLESRNPDTYFPVLKLQSATWLELKGMFDKSALDFDHTYEVRLFIKMDANATGWDNPLTVKYNVSGEVNYSNLSKGIPVAAYVNDFAEYSLGTVTVPSNKVITPLQFTVWETSGHTKTGLYIKAVRLISYPKSSRSSS